MRRIIIMACVLSTFLLSACATLHNRDKSRDQTLEAYAAALRWGGFQNGWSYVDPEVRAAHPLTPQQKALYNPVRIAEYDTTGPVATGPDTVEQTVQITLIAKASQRVYTVVDQQRWRWDDQARQWWLESGLPDVSH
jgi:uncharacterized protein YceK